MISNNITRAFGILTIGFLAFSSGETRAQTPERQTRGFVRLLNAVSVGTGKLEFLIDGKTMRPAGYQPGNVTGGIALVPGSHRITFRREGVEDGETRIQVAADDTTILIPFAEQVPATDDEPAHWAIRILRLKQQQSENKRTASFVSVSREPDIKVEIRQSGGQWEALHVKRLDVVRTSIQQARGYLPVRSGDRELSAVSVGPAGNYVSVLFDDENGALRSQTFQDYKYLSADNQ